MIYFIIYYIAINVITFIIYGVDKQKAIRHTYRISEVTLLCLALIGGGLGALLGMFFFHHKTRKLRFRLTVPFSIALHVFAWLFIL